MNLTIFFLALLLLAQGIMALTILGSAFRWPKDKLDNRNLLFLLMMWLAPAGLVVVLRVSLLGALWGLALAILAFGAARFSGKRQWILTGIFCLLSTIGLALLVF